MFTRLLAGSVLGMTLVTFSPGANALSTGQAERDIREGQQDILQGDRLIKQGIADILMHRVRQGESDISKGEQGIRGGEADIAEGERILASHH